MFADIAYGGAICLSLFDYVNDVLHVFVDDV